jgi:nucleotide-binding universal stress UspA family protein
MQLKTILCPTDFAGPSGVALDYAATLARDHHARLVIFHAVETLGPENVTYGEAVSQPQPASYRKRLWDDLHRVRSPDPQVPVEYAMAEGDPAAAIVRVAAEKNCDLIVMGTQGRSGLRRLLEGSVAEHVVRWAHCPVLVVKALQPPSHLPPQQTTDSEAHSLAENRGLRSTPEKTSQTPSPPLVK